MADRKPPDESAPDMKQLATNAIWFLVILAAIAAVGIWVPPNLRTWSWAIVFALMTLSIMLAGKSIKGLWRGCLIDSRCKFSLSRLQMIGWTILVLSGYLIAVLANIRADAPDPLAIAVPQELWILMGISTTSLVASPLMLSTKRGRAKKPDPDQTDATMARLKEQGQARVTCDGFVVENDDPKEAQWSDLFRGEETGNAANLDVSKIQMFYFTFILWIAYAVALGRGFLEGAETFNQLPTVSAGMLALLGISHTGYLGHKAAPLSKEEAPPATTEGVKR